ncbi:ribosome small subunit-dependent GTPase A [Viridibacillus arvi]|uniref:ribosome small subunit-dependent GTPase A n=1 Tax=Viridibacillus arvi TaxID=263475 RepID=UPI003D2B46C6
MNIEMKDLGLNDFFLKEAKHFEGFHVGRVSSLSKGIYKLITDQGELKAEVSGKFRFKATGARDYPTVGDFVMIKRADGNSIIHHVLSRKSLLVRKEAGMTQETQLIAANIDKIFICMSLNNDFNIRRMERYLSIAWDSEAVPVIVLTKADLCENVEAMLEEVSKISIGVDVIVTSSVDNEGYEPIKNYLSGGQTVAFIGSSGVGKSTLINALLGQELIETRGLRNDDKGKHTTTRRELFMIEDLGVVIDTPGMRELGVQSVDLSKSFSDIDALTKQCKFKDCQHKSEPGCAVQQAITNGELSNNRLQSYQKVEREAKHAELKAESREKERLKDRLDNLRETKRIRKAAKAKNRRR